MATLDEVLEELRGQANSHNAEGMARFGIRGAVVLGISVQTLRSMAKRIGRDHELALGLWASGIHEARILASLVAEPAHTTPELMEAWLADFDSWDLCDQVCSNLFEKIPGAYERVLHWCRREEEFVRRAGFVMIAGRAVHDKQAGDDVFVACFPLIQEYAGDERNFVKKAVNWALRQIGKRNRRLGELAIACAHELRQQPSRSARWIANDALRELETRYEKMV